MPINEDRKNLNPLEEALLVHREEDIKLGDSMTVEEFEMMSKAYSNEGKEIFYNGDTHMPDQLTPMQERDVQKYISEQESTEKKG